MSVPGPDESSAAATRRIANAAARTRVPSPRRERPRLPGSAASDNGASRSNLVPIPEKSELRSHRRSIVDAVARPKQAPEKREEEEEEEQQQQQQQPKEAVVRDDTVAIAAYEPGYVLRRNAEYFDVDQDGIIWLRDTYTGCRKLGAYPFKLPAEKYGDRLTVDNCRMGNHILLPGHDRSSFHPLLSHQPKLHP